MNFRFQYLLAASWQGFPPRAILQTNFEVNFLGSDQVPAYTIDSSPPQLSVSAEKIFGFSSFLQPTTAGPVQVSDRLVHVRARCHDELDSARGPLLPSPKGYPARQLAGWGGGRYVAGAGERARPRRGRIAGRASLRRAPAPPNPRGSLQCHVGFFCRKTDLAKT
jgi:hypothetical protein